MREHKLAAAALVLLLSAAPAAACTGTTVLFEDDFSFADPAWGNFQGTAIANGQMTIQPEPGLYYLLLNQAALYQDFDACIDVVQHVTDPSAGWASLMFWGVDYENFYALEVAGNGYVKVTRVQNNRWLYPVDWILTENVVNPGEQVNSLRVRVIGNIAEVFVNDQQIARFRGQPPQGGGLIGVHGLAPEGTVATFEFKNLRITTPDGPIERPGFGPDEGEGAEGDGDGEGGDGGSDGAPEPGPAEDVSGAALGKKS